MIYVFRLPPVARNFNAIGNATRIVKLAKHKRNVHFYPLIIDLRHFIIKFRENIYFILTDSWNTNSRNLIK